MPMHYDAMDDVRHKRPTKDTGSRAPFFFFFFFFFFLLLILLTMFLLFLLFMKNLY